jgi:hypothetical protein
MELFVIWFVAFVATGEAIKDTQTELMLTQHQVSVLEDEYESLASKHNLLAAKHSSFYAGQQLVDEAQDQRLDAIETKVNELQNN